MAPDERRAAIIQATIPLLREHGLDVSTRQIARAAGVAEGTLFGVFPDKPALIRAAVISTFAPEPVVAALAAIDPAADLRQRLVAALEILRQRFLRNAALMGALRASITRTAQATTDAQATREFFAQMERSRTEILAALRALIEPDRTLLRRGPETAAQLLFQLTTSSARGLGGTEPMESAEIVTLILDGLLVRPEHGEGPT
jgi:AcrR family transcriptional regulator